MLSFLLGYAVGAESSGRRLTPAAMLKAAVFLCLLTCSGYHVIGALAPPVVTCAKTTFWAYTFCELEQSAATVSYWFMALAVVLGACVFAIGAAGSSEAESSDQ